MSISQMFDAAKAEKPKLIPPTNGRIVWFTPDTLFCGVQLEPKKPLAATICHVHSYRMVNISVLDSNGNSWPARNVPLLQPGDVPPSGGTRFCEWMPFQKVQAAKTEAMEAFQSRVALEKVAEQVENAKPSGAPEWFGRHLSEDEIVADVVSNIEHHGLSCLWLDPESFRLPLDEDGKPKAVMPKNAGRLMFVGMSIRNHYGLWHHPQTRKGDDAILTDGVITDPMHPDNMSQRIIDRVVQTLREHRAE